MLCYDIGCVISKEGQDYIVVARNGKKLLEKFNDSWHDDIYEINSDKDGFREFVTEFLEEYPKAFPGVHMPLYQKLVLAGSLWKKHCDDSNIRKY
jgi:hypothetical protein